MEPPLIDSNASAADYAEALYTVRSASSDWLLDYDAADYEAAASVESPISVMCRQAARYYVACVIVFGLFGNLGCLVCYRQSDELKRYRSTGYLMALAVSDLTFLLCLSFVWLKSVGITWQDIQFVCQTSVYASNASIFLSAWYVMALTGEMAFALSRPYSAYAAAVNASKTVFIRIFAVTLFGLAVNSWTLALTQTGTTVTIDAASLVKPIDERADYETLPAESELQASATLLDDLFNDTSSDFPHAWTYDLGCHISSNNQLLHQTFVLFDIIITYSVPLLATLLLNCYIGYKLIDAGRRRRYMSKSALLNTKMRSLWNKNQVGNNHKQESDMDATCFTSAMNKKRRDAQQLDGCPLTPSDVLRLNSSNGRRLLRMVRRNSRNKEVTISSLLIAKSIAYLIFNTPSCAHRIWSMLKRQAAADITAAENESNESWTQLIIYILFYTQFSINFLLYSYHAYTRRKCKTGRMAKALFKRPFPTPCY